MTTTTALETSRSLTAAEIAAGNAAKVTAAWRAALRVAEIYRARGRYPNLVAEIATARTIRELQPPLSRLLELAESSLDWQRALIPEIRAAHLCVCFALSPAIGGATGCAGFVY